MKKTNKLRKGISLIELLLTLAILSITMIAIYSVFLTGNKSFTASKDKGFAQQDGRFIADYLKKELRYSSKISKDEIETGRYFSLQLEEGKLIRIEYKDGEEINKKELSDIDGKEIELEREGHALVGRFKVETSKQELPITIPLENIQEFNIDTAINLSSKVFYALAEDTFIEQNNGNNPPDNDGNNEGNNNGEGEGNQPLNPSDYPAWEPDKAYNGGDYVIYNGKTYKARYYTHNVTPGTNYDGWFEISDYWVSGNIYEQGYIVIYEERKYKAKWYSKGDKPGISNVWQLID